VNSDKLRLLQDAWTHRDEAPLAAAVGKMRMMATTGRTLVTRPRPDGAGNYGPCFRYVS